MGILDAYQDSTDTALRVMATQPLTPEPVTPKHSTWSAPFRAVAAGAAEVAGNVMDTAGAFGQVAAASGGWRRVSTRTPERTESARWRSPTT